MDKNVREARMKYGQIKSQSEQMAKLDRCIWCGKKITRFCNSHSIPQFVIKNIDAEGKIDYMNTIMDIPLIKSDLGVKEAGTFKLLCNDCDGKIFQNYENPEKIIEFPSERMLEEIALKNVLVHIGKRRYEIELYKTLKKTFDKPFPYEAKSQVNDLDLRDYQRNFQRIKCMMEGTEDKKFKLVFWEKLPYKVPIAFQGEVTLYGDLEGEIVNDIYNKNTDIVMKDLHILVFPVLNETVITLFYHEDDIEYDKFCEQFQRLNLEEQLEVVNYLIFEYSEDMLISKRIKHKTYVKKKLKEICPDTMEILAFSLEQVSMKIEQKKRALVKKNRKDVPNLLLEKYKLE